MRAEKKSIVASVQALLEGGAMLIVTDHTGLSSSSMTELRGLLQRGGARYMVVKNRLLKRALGEERAAPLAGALEGPTALAVTAGNSAAFSKIIVEFAKKNQGPRVKAGFLDGALLTEAEVGALASLPARPVLMAMFLGSVRAPITGFVCGLSGILRQFVSVLDQVARKRAAH
ncbi:MAG TPA: 50S ribosomal protein L10 [bacterium]|jgi:large subunit ribosomal protein L10|nr:50S ribosomal protein L10 [Chlamydiota bacterium]HOE27933.1 50S ribosomal protein L10 [bacterium]